MDWMFGIEKMKVKECKYCGQDRELLTHVNSLEGQRYDLYKFCTCQESQDKLEDYRKKIVEKRLAYKHYQYFEIVKDVKLVSREYNKQRLDNEVLIHNLDVFIEKFCDYDSDIVKDIKMYYNEKYNDNIQNITNDQYFNRLTKIYFEMFSL